MSVNIVMSGEGTDDYVECSSSRPDLKPKGRLFKKQILHLGSFNHPKVPGKKIVVDKTFAQKLVDNFKAGVCDIVQVPLVNDANQHVEAPDRNIGRVVDVDYDDRGVYAYVDAMKHADDIGKTLIGASAMMHPDYTDPRTGEHCGPTLFHVAITNRPYITNLSDFDEIISASADTSNEETVLLGAANDETPSEEAQSTTSVVEAGSDPSTDGVSTSSDETVLSGAADNEENEMPKTLEELFAALKEDHNIDVAALQQSVADKDAEIASLSASVAAKDSEIVSLSSAVGGEGTLSIDEIANAVLELSNKAEEQAGVIATLTSEREALRLSAATTEIDALVQEGRILPKQRDKMLELSMNDRETFEAILPESPIVSLSESGVTTHESTLGAADVEKQDEVKRLLEIAKKR